MSGLPVNTVGKSRRSGVKRRLLVVALVLVAAVLLGRSFRGNSGVPRAFDNGLTLAAGTARSAESGRPVLAFATADWCGPCLAFKRGALANDELNRMIAELTVPVYLDVDKDAEGSRRLGVRSIPVLVLLRNGEAVARLEGARPAAEVRDWLLASIGGGH